ncbi:MAG TPA: DUF4968 domain-containing protein, partial [Vicinamibacteria bacterium]|nr:DUF4968 domain-containing protein [Vicinamibacteria bacterium]
MRITIGLAIFATAAATFASGQERLADGVALKVGERRLEVRVCREDVVRVVFAPPGPFFDRRSLVTVDGACRPAPFEVEEAAGVLAVRTKRLAARVDRSSGALTFVDHEGRPLLQEKKGGGKSLQPAQVMGESTFHVQAEFEPGAKEGLYGLGAHQNGLMDYAGRDVDMYQLNTV